MRSGRHLAAAAVLLAAAAFHAPTSAHAGEAHGCVNVYRWGAHHWVRLCTDPRPVRHHPRRAAPPHPVAGPPYRLQQRLWLWVTGYCLHGTLTFAGTVPGWGTVASNVLPLYAHVYVPSLGYAGVVLDRGAPLDLYNPVCGATYAYTGWREVWVR